MRKNLQKSEIKTLPFPYQLTINQGHLHIINSLTMDSCMGVWSPSSEDGAIATILSSTEVEVVEGGCGW